MGQKNTVRHDDDQFCCDFLESGIFVSKVFWLKDRELLVNGTAFDGTVDDLSAAPRPSVGLGIDSCNIVASA